MLADTRPASIGSIALSLSDLLGSVYTDAVCGAQAFLGNGDVRELRALANERVDFYPPSFARRQDELLPLVGTRVADPLAASARGAGSKGVTEASRTDRAPLSGHGLYRVGEDGRLYLASKAEHYHLSIGHHFPGYRLLEHARRLGVPNCTHNNTRGHVTRLLEERLIAAANGLDAGPISGGNAADAAVLRAVLDSTDPRTINRVINLETGSLAVEAALKMALARFYRFEREGAAPPYEGRVPVFLVFGDYDGGTGANYHGTTTLTQVMRGLWPALGGKLESGEAMLVRPVKINDVADFEAVLERWDTGRFKVAAFFHEIVLMNYGAVLIRQDYLERVYSLCCGHDVPVVADEIQSCIWSPDVFLFREYGLQPDIVSVGKGCPGGEYPAARILATSALDCLPQFGALVTNGQEEIASLAFLVTMAFARANAGFIRDTGEYYEQRLAALVGRHAGTVERREGRRHLASLVFADIGKLSRFVAALNAAGIDISPEDRLKSPSASTRRRTGPS